MSIHVLERTSAPAAAPTKVGQHWINTLTGEQWLASGTATVADWIALEDVIAVWGGITGTLSAQTDLQAALDAKVDENVAITGATFTKITYDAKGLVTGGSNATTADIADSLNKRYVTDADIVDIGNLSGTNTGDQTITLTGQVTGTGTGSFAATVDKTAITGKAAVSVASGDLLLISDISDTNNLKKVTAGDIASLVNLTGFVPYTGATGDITLGTRNIKMASGTLKDAANLDSVVINNRALQTAAGVNNVQWGTYELFDSLTALSQNWDTRKLYGTDGITVEVDWSKSTYSLGTFINTLQVDNIFPALNSSVSIGSAGDTDITFRDVYFGSGGGNFTDSSNNKAIEATPSNRKLYDTSGTLLSVDWGGRQLYDVTTTLSLDWGNRQLFNPSLTTMLDWNGSDINVYTNIQMPSYEVTANILRGNSLSNTFGQNLIDTASFAYYDGSAVVAINMSSRQLLDSTGSAVAISWNDRWLTDSANSTVVDWQLGTLRTGGNLSVDWSGRTLNESGSNTTLDWQNFYLVHNGLVSLNWGSRELFDSVPVLSLNYDTRVAYDSVGNASHDWQSRYLNDSLGSIAINYDSRLMSSGSGTSALSFENRQLFDSGGAVVCNWSSKELYTSSGTTMLNWGNSTGLRLIGTQIGRTALNLAPTATLHLDVGNATATALKFTAGTTTGTTSTDGFDVGITTAGVAEIRQRENLALQLYSNNTLRMQFSGAGVIQETAGKAVAYVAKTGAYTLVVTDQVVNCTSGTFALTLPTAVGTSGVGQVYILKNSGTGVITINTTSAQTIDGVASGVLTLVQWDSLTVMSDNANWMVIS